MVIVGRPGRQDDGKPPNVEAPAGTGYADCIRGGLRSCLVRPELHEDSDSAGSGAVAAALAATLAAPRDAPLHLLLESAHLSHFLFKNLRAWEDEGWAGVRGARYIAALVNQLRQRCAPTTFKVASTGEEGRQVLQARKRRDEAILAGELRTIHPVAKTAFKLSGAKLACLTQSTAYQSIRARAAPPPRNTTVIIMAGIRTHLDSTPGEETEEADIWRGIRHRDIRRNVSDFLWKGIHGAHRVGTFWTKIPKYEDRATCPVCDDLESMEHILLRCRAVGPDLIWSLVQDLWEKKGLTWEHLGINDVWAIGPRSQSIAGAAKTPKCVARLWRILISESAHLIWKLRCDRVIANGDADGWQHTSESVSAQWEAAVNARLRQDAAGTSRKYGRLALKKDLVLATWRGTLKDERTLPDDWTKVHRVLVGIEMGAAAPAAQNILRVPHWPP
ncbi:hypothetical protein FOMPIDRAFT_1125028 [Fomitopsis schrenkii]|uniref:Reverse transcriptase zinc-binding domain-containing protein n=1 Tax=Fomitopsis schrenkii TaxID=2126942 RepID=S8E1U2_FOMSC|nr:hypothetical protein FOMPIDRAFT_1125028 [Fomitopsis schrenkii]